MRLTKTSTMKGLPLLCFTVFLIGIVLNNSCHVMCLLIRFILSLKGDIPLLTLLNRINWILYISTFQAFALFLECIIERTIKISLYHIIHALANISISSGFLYLAFFKYGVSSASAETLPFELRLIDYVFAYLLILTVSLYYTTSLTPTTPRILRNQIYSLKAFFLIYLVLEMGAANNFGTVILFGRYRYLFYTLSGLLSCFLIYFARRRLLALRVFNLRQDVASDETFKFLAQFRDILEQLSYATALKELAYLSQAFFKSAFAIPLSYTRLYVRPLSQEQSPAAVPRNVEQFLGKGANQAALQALRQAQIWIRDEIEFTHFYEPDQASREIIQFLNAINAELFLPIFERSTITAYIIVERDARPEKLFTNKERDEMLVFTAYVSNIITLLKYSNVEAIHQQQKEVADELYFKEQKNNHYKESIRSLLPSNAERKIGVIFYRDSKFVIANDAARDIITIDLNADVEHIVTQACTWVVRQVQQYKSSQAVSAQNCAGNKITIVGMQSFEDQAPLLLVSYSEISDSMKSQFDQLKDPSLWNYIVCLETTQSGRLINQLIPGTGEKLLHYKINLLKTALSKKATLFTMPEEDLIPTVERVHSISLRQTLKVLHLTSPEQDHEIAIKLFGLNPLTQKDSELALLERLDTTGTLFIQNIEYLSIETQNYLAEFIASGFFHRYESDHKTVSNVRVICSSTKDLAALVLEGRFSKALFHELQKSSLKMPPLSTLSDAEIESLVQGFAEQLTLHGAHVLTDKDKRKLLADRPSSLYEFRKRMHELIKAKPISREDVPFDPAIVSDPDIAQVVQRGKNALQDPQSMTLLWNKFRNQNKIATILGVNRSSVTRRCREYNLK